MTKFLQSDHIKKKFYNKLVRKALSSALHDANIFMGIENI